MVERIGNEEGIEFGANNEAAETILVAQADTGTAAQPAPTTAETRLVVELEDGAVLRLPATASVDQPRENGTDLEFVQPDGTVIVVPNGAIQGLTIFIGSAEIPPLTVAALFESNGIETAAGPAGAGARGSGGNFEVPVGGIGDAFAIGGLLGPTELLFGSPLDQPLYEGLIDSEPTVGANGMAMLDDDDLPGGIAGGLGDDASGPLTGILSHDYGINGVGSLVLTGVALPPGLGFASALSPDGLVLTISQNGTDVLRVTLADSTSGAYTIAQLAPIHHPGAGEDNVLFELTYRVTDSDGDFIDGKMTVNVDDDTPVAGVDASIALPVLVVDESTGTGSGTDGQLSATASFAANFGASPAFGADGAGSVNYELILDGNNVASGLFAVDPAAAGGKGAEIVLNQGVGGVITGSVNGVDYFTVSVDVTGKVTFTLTGNAPVWHANTGDHDDASTLDVAANKLLLQQTITDADGDSDSASVDIGSAKIFTVEDDGPKAAIDQAIALPVLVVDESTGTGSGTDGQLSATASFAANFGASPAFGADGAGSVNYELILDGNNVASGLFAVDPAAAGGKGAEIVLNQGVGGVITGSVNGVDYFTVSVDVTGKVTFTLTGNAPVWHANTGDHDDASTLDVAANKLLLQQTITDADGDSDSASVDIGSAKIFTVEDDGPKAAIDQAVALPVLVVDESTGTGSGTDGQLSATASFAANFGASPAFGADGAGSVNYELILDGNNVASGLFAVDPAAAGGKGAEIVLNQGVGGVITGSVNGVDYFTVSVDVTGKVTFTLTGNAPVWHANTGDHDDASTLDVAANKLLLQQTITDADGDSDSASVDIGSAKIFTVEDDGPTATVVTNAAFSLTHDETPFVQGGTNDATVLNALLLAGRFAGVNLPGQDPQSLLGLPLGIAQSTVAAVTISALGYGADGAAASNSLVYGFSLTDALGQAVLGQVDSGLMTTEGKPIYLFIENGLVVGRFDGADAATDVSSSDPAAFALHIDPQSGQVTLIQYVSLFHGDASNANDVVSLDQIAGALNATVTLTDGDGDKLTVSASIGANIHFRDDAPTGFNTTSAIVLDDEAQSLFPANPGPLFGGDVLLDFANTGGLPGSLFIAGVDGVSVIEMSTKPAFSVIYEAGGLAAQEAVAWDNGVTAPDGSVTFTAFGAVTNSAAATLTVNVDGSYVFSLFKPVVHDIGGGENDKGLSFGLTVTDGDGDKALSGLTIWVDDDTPVGRTVNNFGPLDDEAQTLFAGNNLPADLVANEKAVSGGPGALFRAGADGLASVDLITPPSLSVIYKDGPNGIPEAITDWVKTVDPVTGVTTFAAISQHYPLATPAATLVVRPDGSYSLTLNAPVVHSVSQANEESAELRFGLRITDGDGDTDTARLTVRVNDDAPTLNTAGQVVATVDEDGLAGANIDAGRTGERDGGGSASFTSASGALNGLVNFGSDGMGAFSIKSVTAQDTGVNSKGADVLVSGSGNILYGYAEGGGGAGYQAGVDRLVFTLTVNPNGSYTFTLNDQIDHPPATGQSDDDTENLLSSRIDLSRYVQATDGDGDTVTLGTDSFRVDVRDDIPVITARDAGVQPSTPVGYGSIGGGGQALYKLVDGQDNFDLMVSGRKGNTPDTVNSSNDLGVGQSQNINGKSGGDAEEYLRFDFVKNGATTGNNTSTTYTADAHYSVQSFAFKIAQIQGGPSERVPVFLQIFSVAAGADNSGNLATANAGALNDDQVLAIAQIKVNGSLVSATVVYEADGTTIKGYLITDIKEGDNIEVVGSSDFGRLVVANYGGVTIQTGVGTTQTLPEANSFGVTPTSSSRTGDPEVFAIRHDETQGVNGPASPTNPNADDDTAANAPNAVKIVNVTAIGYAQSATSVLGGNNPLFNGKVGADENGTYSFRLTDANGGNLTNVNSGLKTLDGTALVLSTNAAGALEGRAGVGGAIVFKAYVDSDGYVWVAQFSAIRHDVGGSNAAAHDEIASVMAAVHITGTLQDFDGDKVSVTSPVALQIQFQDDGPVVVADTNSLFEDGAAISGNVLSNDTAGSDGVGSLAWANDNGSHVINGLYGQLTVTANGGYTYTLYTQAQNLTAYVKVQALTDGQSLSEQFAYTLTDGDGDSAQTTLTVAINGADDAVTITSGLDNTNGDVVVDEKGLATGSDAAGTSEVGTGSFSFQAPDGLQSIKIGASTIGAAQLNALLPGQSILVTPAAGEPTFGTLEITGYTPSALGGTVHYRFTLTNTLSHPDSSTSDGDGDRGAADQIVGGSFAVTITDSDNSAKSGTLRVAVNDDGPSASALNLSATEGQAPLTGFFSFVGGADGATVTAVNGIPLTFTAGWSQTFLGDHGELRFKANGEYEFKVQGEEPWVSHGTDNFTITVTDGDNDQASAVMTITVADTIQTNFFMLDDVTVDETGSFVYTAHMDFASLLPVTITLDNDVQIIFNPGQKTASSVVQAAQGDDVYKDGTVTQIGIKDISHNFEAVNTSDKATITVTDTIDITTVSLTATASITEAGTVIVYTATLSNPAQAGSPVTVTLDNGKIITIAGGASSGTVDHTVTADEDVYLDPQTVSAQITSATGGNFEQLDIDATPAVTDITDTIDITTVSLTATASITEAGTVIVYTATLSNPAQAGSPVTVTLDNGKIITIAGGTSSGTVDHTVTPDEDVYLDPKTVSAQITSATGGNFERLDIDATPAVTDITDTIDITTVSLTATASITEAGTVIVYTATLSNPAQAGSPVTVTLDNGKIITIAGGTSSGTVDHTVTPDEDVYLDPQTVSAKITDATGGNFEQLDIDATPAVTDITDTIDITTVSLTATASITEAGTVIVYTATLSNPAQAGSPVTVTLDNGKIITIAGGTSSGTVDHTVTPDEDVYLDPQTVSAKITDATGGNFEQLDIDATPAVTDITDTIDITTVSLTATASITEAGTVIVYTATLSNPAQAGSPVTVTLDNGKTITIAGGASSASINHAVTPDEDVYLDPKTVSAKITDATGGNFEQLDIDPAPAVTDITDTIDTVTATLTAGAPTYDTTGVNIAYTVTLSAGMTPFAPTDGPLTFTLANGTQVVLAAGETTKTVNVHYNFGYANPITNAINGVTGAEEFEHLATAGSTSVTANTFPQVVDGVTSLTVSEAALDTIKADSDLAAGSKTGTNPNSPGETAVDANAFTFRATGENITSITFANPAGSGAALANMASGVPSWALSNGGRTLTLSINGQTAMILSLTGASSAAAGTDAVVGVTATLVSNFSHLAPNSLLDVILSGVQVEATDASGDKAIGTISVNVIDDAPTAFAPDAGAVINVPGQSAMGYLDSDGDLHGNLGADGGSFRFSESLNNANSGLTSGGLPITYAVSANGLTLTASSPAGTVFTVTLNPNSSGANDTYSINMIGSVDGGANQVSFSSASYAFTGGNTAWAAFTTPANDGSRDLLLTPIGSGGQTVNGNASSAGIGGGSGGQAIGGNEGIRLDFVRDVLGNPQSGGSGYQDPTRRNHTFDEHYQVNGAVVKFADGASNTKVQFAAFQDADGNNAVGDGARESITALAIQFDGETEYVTFANIGTVATSFTIGSPGGLDDRTFTIQFVDLDPGAGVTYGLTVVGANGSSSIAGVNFATFTADGYNSLELTYVSGTAFTVGGFGTTSIAQGTPVNLSLPIDLIDTDGDKVSNALNLTLMPAGTADHSGSGSAINLLLDTNHPNVIGSQFGDVITSFGTEANSISGGGGGDNISGGGGNDQIWGGSGNDILTGGDGDDILIGGLGNDVLTGGAGRDTFVFTEAGAANSDTISDYVVNEDTIDLSALLDAAQIDSANVGNFVRVQDTGTNGLLQVNTDGAGNDWVDVATLTGHGTPNVIIDIKIDNEDHQIPII